MQAASDPLAREFRTRAVLSGGHCAGPSPIFSWGTDPQLPSSREARQFCEDSLANPFRPSHFPSFCADRSTPLNSASMGPSLFHCKPLPSSPSPKAGIPASNWKPNSKCDSCADLSTCHTYPRANPLPQFPDMRSPHPFPLEISSQSLPETASLFQGTLPHFRKWIAFPLPSTPSSLPLPRYFS